MFVLQIIFFFGTSSLLMLSKLSNSLLLKSTLTRFITKSYGSENLPVRCSKGRLMQSTKMAETVFKGTLLLSIIDHLLKQIPERTMTSLLLQAKSKEGQK